MIKPPTAALLLVAVSFAPAIGIGASAAVASSAHAPLARGCRITSQGYIHSFGKCARVPRHGHFSLKVPGTHVVLKGTGTPKTAGTEIGVTKVPSPCPSLTGPGIRVDANGKMPALKPKKGKAYRFVPATGKCVKAPAIKKAGIFEVVGG